MACADERVDVSPPVDSSVQTVTLSPPGPVNMNLHTTVTFSASVVGGPALTNHGVIWSSANADIATVDQTGIVTADSVGTTTIIAASKANTAILGSAVITVTAPVSARTP